MKLPDVNIWLALSLSGHSHHEVSREWLDRQSAPGSIRFCRTTQQGLLRLLTTEAVFTPYGMKPLTNQAAWEISSQLLADDRMALTAEPPGVEERWKSWAATLSPSPKLWMDAWLAAFAYESGLQLVTTDKAFTQFRNLDCCIIST